ncbi:hypothetical protein QCE62_06985 [Caballeronia sp. LZ033]|uniref:hypothetical protein n=1 Tax=Caballeronia sp. LZ033 TaxID=3038566 RepID=UPI0028597450|nr:hypothetical protein [Caballeronia sp. LZ033]MDR5813336.1 hypothetical protein [Caballeronia sp. LZ033]
MTYSSISEIVAKKLRTAHQAVSDHRTYAIEFVLALRQRLIVSDREFALLNPQNSFGGRSLIGWEIIQTDEELTKFEDGALFFGVALHFAVGPQKALLVLPVKLERSGGDAAFTLGRSGKVGRYEVWSNDFSVVATNAVTAFGVAATKLSFSGLGPHEVVID